jgi:hypothetical protein
MEVSKAALLETSALNQSELVVIQTNRSNLGDQSEQSHPLKHTLQSNSRHDTSGRDKTNTLDATLLTGSLSSTKLSTKFDYKRMDILNHTMHSIHNSSNFTQVIESALENINQLINCRVAQCMIIKHNIVKRVDLKKLIIQKEKIEGQYIDIVANTDKLLGKPAFRSIKHAKEELFNIKNISLPIISDEDELIATIQVEAFPKTYLGSTDDPLTSNKFFGFSQMDRIVLSLIKTVMEVKLDNIYALQQRKTMQREVLQAIKLSGTICNQRNKISLLREMKQQLPRFFGFEDVGVVFRDVKRNQLFTMNVLSQDEQELWLKDRMEAKGEKLYSEQDTE